MNNVNSYNEFQKIIDSKTNGVNHFYLEITDINFTFDLQIVWVDDVLRKKSTNIDDKISINFTNCNFKNLDSSNIPQQNSVEVNIFGGIIEELTIINSVFVSKFYINKQYASDKYGRKKREIKIGKCIISDSVFKDNFKLHNAQLTYFSIEDTDFERHADFFKSTFQKGLLLADEEENISENDIGFRAINFRGLALFGDTEFKRKLIFKYVTFESYSHFRKAKVEKGLDLDYSNIENEMNFFGVQGLDSSKSKTRTSQETYRIIKHNFEKIGNKIEANKYHALELSKNRKNIWDNFCEYCTLELFQRGVVSSIHCMSSKYSTSWIIALFWIFVIGLVTNAALLYTISYDRIFQYISIISKIDDFNGNHIVFLLNKVSLGYLYYQFLSSIRKDTRN